MYDASHRASFDVGDPLCALEEVKAPANRERIASSLSFLGGDTQREEHRTGPPLS
jgi:hypothetical protein